MKETNIYVYQSVIYFVHANASSSPTFQRRPAKSYHILKYIINTTWYNSSNEKLHIVER